MTNMVLRLLLFVLKQLKLHFCIKGATQTKQFIIINIIIIMINNSSSSKIVTLLIVKVKMLKNNFHEMFITGGDYIDVFFFPVTA